MYSSVAKLNSRGVIWCVIKYIKRRCKGRELVVGFVDIRYLAQGGVWVGPLWVVRCRILLLGRFSCDVTVDRNVNAVTRRRRIE